MMENNVIQISDWRAGKKSSGPIHIPPEWMFNLSAYVGVNGFEGTITAFNDQSIAEPMEPAERLRKYVAALDALSWMLLQQAENMTPSEKGIPLATAMVFEDSTVRVRINDDRVTTHEQFEWLDRRFDDAKAAARPKPL